MSEAYEIIREEPGFVLALYRRADSANFFFDLRGEVVGKRIRRTTGKADRDEAAMMAETVLRKVLRGEPLRTKLVREVVREFLDQMDGTDQHREAARRVLEDHFVIELGDRPIAEVSDEDILEYVKARKRHNESKSEWMLMERNGRTMRVKRPASHFKPPKVATLNREANHIRNLFKFARQKRYCTRSDIPEVKNGYAAIEQRPWFRLDEYHRMRRVLNERVATSLRYQNLKMHRSAGRWKIEHELPHDLLVKQASPAKLESYRQNRLLRCFFVMLIQTGLRPTEAHNLCWGDLRSYTYRSGKQGIELLVRAKNLKRSVIVNPKLRGEFEQIAKSTRGGSIEEARRVHRTDKVFPQNSFKKAFSTACRTAGLPNHSIYSCRHTFINFSLLYRRMPIHEVSVITGASIETINRHYQDISPMLFAERDEDVEAF